jgi:hypothetical protein
MKPMLDSFGRQKTEEDLMNLFKLINGMRHFPCQRVPLPIHRSPITAYCCGKLSFGEAEEISYTDS